MNAIQRYRRLSARSGPRQWLWAAAAVLACGLVGGVVGHFSKPPGGTVSPTAGSRIVVWVGAVNLGQLEAAHVPTSNAGISPKVRFWRPKSQHYGGYLSATGPDQRTSLDYAVTAGLDYVRILTRHENVLMRRAHPSKRIRRLQSEVIHQPSRFRVYYTPGQTPVVGRLAPAPWRTGLIGAMVGVLLLCLGQLVAVPALTAPHDRSRPRPVGPLRTAATLVAGLALAGILAALASKSSGAYTVVSVGLMFAAAFALTQRAGVPAIRSLIAFVIVSSALRGAFLGLSNAISLPDGLTIVNAIQPAIIAGCAASVLLTRQGRFPRDTRPLLVGWVVIAVVAILDLGTESVGYHVYGIGLAQYLVYPTMAILAWLIFERGDAGRLVRLLVAVGAVVAISVFLEAAGLVHWVEAAAPGGNPFIGKRYGGATGSYLHASIFLGTAAVLALGLVIEGWRRREGRIAAIVLVAILGGLALTLSRGGFVIAGIGAVALLVGAERPDRRRLLATGAAAIAVAAVLSVAGGVTPGKITSRLSAGFNANGDPGNESRLQSWRHSLDDYKALPIQQKAFGEGLAATGNARTIASLQPIATESYPLKLLLEVGAFGLLAIGAYLVWAVIRFGRAALRGASQHVRAAAAAGVGLSLYGLVYPTLEVQLIAMTWWLLLVVCLAASRFEPAGDGRPAGDDRVDEHALDAERPTDASENGGKVGARPVRSRR